MKLILLGSDNFVTPMFNILARLHTVVAVYTKPGTPVATWAYCNHVPCYTDINRFDGSQADYAIVMSYGTIIPDDVLTRCKFINVHPSDLPLYRGPSPIATAIANGDSVSAVCLAEVTHEVDAGGVYLRERFVIGDHDTTEIVQDRVCDIAARLVLRFFDDPSAYRPWPQTGTPTMTHKIRHADKLITWPFDPVDVCNRIRAYGGVLLEVGGVLAKILDATVVGDRLKIITIQPCGKKAMTWKAFLNGHKVASDMIID